jgi:hypothetical protein
MKKPYVLTAIFSLLSAPCFAVLEDDDAVQSIQNKINEIKKKIEIEKARREIFEDGIISCNIYLPIEEKKFDKNEEELSIAYDIQNITNDLIAALEALLPFNHIPTPETTYDKLSKANDYFNSEFFTSEFDKITERFTTLKEYFGDLDSTTIMKNMNNFYIKGYQHPTPKDIIHAMAELKKNVGIYLQSYPWRPHWILPWIDAKFANKWDANDLVPEEEDPFIGFKANTIYETIKDLYGNSGDSKSGLLILPFNTIKSHILYSVSALEKEKYYLEKGMSFMRKELYCDQDRACQHFRNIDELEEEKERLEAEIALSKTAKNPQKKDMDSK